MVVLVVTTCDLTLQTGLEGLTSTARVAVLGTDKIVRRRRREHIATVGRARRVWGDEDGIRRQQHSAEDGEARREPQHG